MARTQEQLGVRELHSQRRRRRIGDLRRRALSLSASLFAALWLVVFAQMGTGHDPVLSAKGGTRAARMQPAAAPPPRHRYMLAVDPVTGAIERVPVDGGSAAAGQIGGSSGQAAAPAPAPAPPPVVTSQS